MTLLASVQYAHHGPGPGVHVAKVQSQRDLESELDGGSPPGIRLGPPQPIKAR